MSTLAAAVGITGAAFVSGSVGGYTFFAIPALLENSHSAADLTKLWSGAFTRGFYIPKLAAASGAAFFYAAGHRYTHGAEWRGYAAGGALVIGFIPYTMIAVAPAIRPLSVAAAKDAVGMPMQEAQRLVALWSSRSIVRCFMAGSAAVLGLWNLLN